MAANPNFKQVFKIQETKEGTFGVAESDNFLKFAVTGLDDGSDSIITEDTQINNDGMDTDVRKQVESAMLTLDFDLRYCASVDALMESAMRNSTGFVDCNFSASDIFFNNSTNVMSMTAGNWVDESFSVGMVVRISGAGVTANNNLAKITTLTTKVMTLSTDWITIGDEVAGETIQVVSDYVRNGNDIVSRTCEREFTGLTEFFAYNGMTVDSLEINIESENDVKGRVVLKGSKRTGSAATVGTGAETAESSAAVFKSNLAVQSFRVDDVIQTIGDKMLKIVINNSLISNYTLGGVNPTSLTLSVFKPTMELQIFLESSTLFDAWEALTPQAIDIVLKDTSDNYYIFTMFRGIAGVEPKIDAGSRDAESLVSVTINGVKKTSAPAYALQICKIDA